MSWSRGLTTPDHLDHLADAPSIVGLVMGVTNFDQPTTRDKFIQNTCMSWLIYRPEISLPGLDKWRLNVQIPALSPGGRVPRAAAFTPIPQWGGRACDHP
jgi:hypothetical protein